jgi:hypothetical protein
VGGGMIESAAIMPRTPFKTRDGVHVDFTIRLPPAAADWTYDVAARHDATMRAVVAQVLEDVRTLWELPKSMAQQLKADAKALGLEQRDYLYYLLRQRFQQVHAGGGGVLEKAQVTKAQKLLEEEEKKG